MVEPYQAVGLVPTMRGIRRRDEIAVNIEHVSHLIKAASWLSSLDSPVRLIAVPGGCPAGFQRRGPLYTDHEEFARECADPYSQGPRPTRWAPWRASGTRT